MTERPGRPESKRSLGEADDIARLHEAVRAALADPALAAGTRALIGDLAAGIDRLAAALGEERRRCLDLERLAMQDTLVPAFNRRGFLEALDRAIAYVARYRARAGLVYIDLNGFKQINDRYGHSAGDAALSAYTVLLRDNVRRSDIVGRVGGDEFGVILWQARAEDAARKAEELASLIAAKEIDHDGAAIRARAAAGGVAIDPQDTPEAALSRADRAMYAAKRGLRR